MCFLITDGYTEDALKETLDYLRYMRQETAVIHVLSAGELRPELDGAMRLTDSENGEHIDLIADRAALDAYLKNEPYVTEGVWQDITVEVMNVVIVNGEKRQ